MFCSLKLCINSFFPVQTCILGGYCPLPVYKKIVKSETDTECTFNFHFKQHGGRRDGCGVYEISLASCVTLCQSRNGIQLQRDEEIHNVASAMDIPGKVRKGVYLVNYSFIVQLLCVWICNVHEHVAVSDSTFSLQILIVFDTGIDHSLVFFS